MQRAYLGGAAFEQHRVSDLVTRTPVQSFASPLPNPGDPYTSRHGVHGLLSVLCSGAMYSLMLLSVGVGRVGTAI